MISLSELHYYIIDHIVQKGFAPEVIQLSETYNTTERTIINRLKDLEEYHGVVLHPNESKIWVAHPFSLAPTNFIVKTAKKLWWGNCVWCSLGVAALIEEDCQILSTFGAHGEPLTIHILEGNILEGEYLIHFPTPMNRCWDNVIYACSTMLIFQDEKQIDKWCITHNIPKGDMQKISEFWEFAKDWYGKHYDRDWKKWTVVEAVELFNKHNLTHHIWNLEDSSDRF